MIDYGQLVITAEMHEAEDPRRIPLNYQNYHCNETTNMQEVKTEDRF